MNLFLRIINILSQYKCFISSHSIRFDSLFISHPKWFLKQINTLRQLKHVWSSMAKTYMYNLYIFLLLDNTKHSSLCLKLEILNGFKQEAWWSSSVVVHHVCDDHIKSSPRRERSCGQRDFWWAAANSALKENVHRPQPWCFSYVRETETWVRSPVPLKSSNYLFFLFLFLVFN